MIKLPLGRISRWEWLYTTPEAEERATGILNLDQWSRAWPTWSLINHTINQFALPITVVSLNETKANQKYLPEKYNCCI